MYMRSKYERMWNPQRSNDCVYTHTTIKRNKSLKTVKAETKCMKIIAELTVCSIFILVP